jgi:hypothetical protein
MINWGCIVWREREGWEKKSRIMILFLLAVYESEH